MATARFIVALVLIALGCALLIVSYDPRPVGSEFVN